MSRLQLAQPPWTWARAKDRLVVHDIVHERQGSAWTTRVGHYPKLRLAPDAVVAQLQQLGLEVIRGAGPRGMVCISASRQP